MKVGDELVDLADELADLYEKELGVKVTAIELLDDKYNFAIMIEKGKERGYFVANLTNPIMPKENEIFSLDSATKPGIPRQQPQQGTPQVRNNPGIPRQ